jgi:hypothetical protein
MLIFRLLQGTPVFLRRVEFEFVHPLIIIKWQADKDSRKIMIFITWGALESF